MKDKTKKIFLIISVTLVVVVVLAFLIYLFLPINQIDPETGERQTLSDVFPIIGNGGGDDETGVGDDGQDNTAEEKPTTAEEVPRLRLVSSEPVADSVVVENSRQTGTSTEKYSEIRYLLRQGQIRAAPADKMEDWTLVSELSDQIQKADWEPGGEGVLFQRLGVDEKGLVIEHVSFSSPTGTSTEALDVNHVSFSPFAAPAVSVDSNPGDSRFILVERTPGGGRLVIRSPQTGQSDVVGTLPISEWTVEWPTQSTVTLTTKPSGLAEGYVYRLPSHGGSMTKILGGIKGLTTKMLPNGVDVLYSQSSDNSIQMFLDDTMNQEDPRRLLVDTLPEKCVAGVELDMVYCAVPKSVPSAVYPDAWYQGKVFFDDEVWEINTETFAVNKILTPNNLVNQEMDIVNLRTGPAGDYLVFTNKKDGSLWSYRLTETQE